MARINKISKEDCNQFFNANFSLMDKQQAKQMLKEKGYVTDEGFVLSKFRQREVFDLDNKVLPFSKTTLMFHRDVKHFGYAFWVLLGNNEDHTILGDVLINCNEVYNLVCAFKSYFPMHEQYFVELLSYKPSSFVEVMATSKGNVNDCLPRDFIMGAENPAFVVADTNKLEGIMNAMGIPKTPIFEVKGIKRTVKAQLFSDQAAPAKVVSTNPLVVAAYVEGFDSAVMLQFDGYFTKTYQLNVGDKLLAVNSYISKSFYDLPNDMVLQQDVTYQFGDVRTKIALFYAQDEGFCRYKATLFASEDWQLLDDAILRHNEKLPGVTRKALNSFI